MALALSLSCGGPSEPGGAVAELWFQSHAGSGFTNSKPEVRGDTVIFGSPGGLVIARRAADGTPIWTAAACGPGGPQGRRFAITGSVLVAACGEDVVALDIATGRRLWTYTTPPDTTYDDLPGVVSLSHPGSDGTTVYVPAWGASVSALTGTTGQVKWVWKLGRLASDTATNVFRSGAKGVEVSGDTAFVTVWHWTNPKGGTSESLLMALDRATGAELWKLVLNANTSGGAVSTPPVLVGDLALVLGQVGELHAVRRSTGQVAWQYKSPAYQFGTLAAPVVVGTTIYTSLGDEKLTALRAEDGAVLWSAGPLGATKDLFATQSRVYAPRQGWVHIHDRATGALIATGRVRVDGQTFTTAAAARGDQIFITSTEGAWSFREPD